jgi:hypothetical protein
LLATLAEIADVKLDGFTNERQGFVTRFACRDTARQVGYIRSE